jgi:V/A-type H+-transporting ATPase subunit D
MQTKLNFAIKGKNFLGYNREQIIVQIKKFWPEYQTLKDDFLILFKKLILKLHETYSGMGKLKFIEISQISKLQHKPLISIKNKKVHGILLPKIEFELTSSEQLPSYSFLDTTHNLDDLIIILKEFFRILIFLAESEDKILKFALYYKRVNNRINGLKYIIVPELQVTIKRLKEFLEEAERENRIRIRFVKKLILNKKERI